MLFRNAANGGTKIRTKLWKNSQWGWWLVGHNGNHSPQIGGVWRGRGPDGEQLGRRPGNTRISSEDQRKYDLVDLSIWSRRKGTSGWREWRHKRKWERKREEEDAESLFVSTKDQLQWWPGFSKIEGNRFCYWTWKKHLHSISLYSFSPNWKNMLFLLSCGVGGCQRRGVIWAVGGIEMAPAIFSTKDTEHDNRSYRPPRCCYWEYS